MYHPAANELNRLMALQAAAKLFTYLPRYHADPSNESHITQLQLACFASLGMKGAEMSGPLGLSHTLGYALGSPYGIPHGITSCITLGHVVQFKAPDPTSAAQIARLAPFIGVDSQQNAVATAIAVGKKILELVDDLGLTTKLKDKGVGEDQVPIIIKRATGGQIDDSSPDFSKFSALVKSML